MTTIRVESECRTCELVQRRDEGLAATWDSVQRTTNWDVAHAYDTSIEGWMVLVVRRHVASLADLTDAETAEVGPLIVRLSRALRDAVGCVKTYVAQFAEDPGHPHVHIHLVPRYSDQPADLRGPAVFGALGVPQHERVSELRTNEITDAIARNQRR